MTVVNVAEPPLSRVYSYRESSFFDWCRLKHKTKRLVYKINMGQQFFKTHLPYYHLFSGVFNFANLEWKYFAGLEFRDFDESPFFKVIKFRESISVLFYHNGIETQHATGNSNEIDCGDRRFWKEYNEAITKKLTQLITENYREQDPGARCRWQIWRLYLGSFTGTNSAKWVRWCRE